MKTYTAVSSSLINEDIYPNFLIGKIHSIYHKVVNIVFDNMYRRRMITIMKDSPTYLPDSINITAEAFNDLLGYSIDDEVIMTSDYLFFNNMKIKFANCKMCKLNKIEEFNPKAIESLIKHKEKITGLKNLSLEKYKNIYESLSNYAKSGNIKDIRNIIGYGSGLTPASDDAIVGITLVLYAKRRLINYDINYINNLISGQTTSVSEKYLVCSLMGYFSEILQNICYSLINNRNLDELIGSLENIGATSGSDILQGIILGVTFNK